MKRVMIVLGTSVEAVKLAPVVKSLDASAELTPIVCVTGAKLVQVREVLDSFGIQPHLYLEAREVGPYDATSCTLLGLRQALDDQLPCFVLVLGNSVTTFAATVASYYAKVPIGHVDAGQRAFDGARAFPEEISSRLVGVVADLHFVATGDAMVSLVADGVPRCQIFQTGDTSIDALLWMSRKVANVPWIDSLCDGRPMILLSAQRRESFGEPLHQILQAVATFAEEHPTFRVVYPLIPNPNVAQPARSILGGLTNVLFTEPLRSEELARLLEVCQFVMTDSAGLQEEASAFAKPVVVLRETIERPAAVEAGRALMVGSDRHRIIGAMRRLADTSSDLYQLMSRAGTLFGDGRAAERIVRIVEGVARHPAPATAGRPVPDFV